MVLTAAILLAPNVDTISVRFRQFTAVVMMDREDEIAAGREDRSYGAV